MATPSPEKKEKQTSKSGGCLGCLGLLAMGSLMYLLLVLVLAVPIVLIAWLVFGVDPVLAALGSFFGVMLLINLIDAAGNLLDLPKDFREMTAFVKTSKGQVYVRNLLIAAAVAVAGLILWKVIADEHAARPPVEPLSPAESVLADPAVRAELEAALALYEREGLSPEGRAALGEINAFASEHLRDHVIFYQEATPWVITADSPDLPAAFVAGAVRAILATGDLRTNSYAGTLEVLRVYRQQKREQPGLSIPELEAFELLDRKGKLRERLEKVDAREEARAAEAGSG